MIDQNLEFSDISVLRTSYKYKKINKTEELLEIVQGILSALQ